MKQRIRKKVDIRLVIPRKEKRLVNISFFKNKEKPILVRSRGKRFFIVDGHHRYYYALQKMKKKIDIEIKWQQKKI